VDDMANRLNLPVIRLDTANPVTEALPQLLREPSWQI
jgi:hypothetical protein